MYKRIFFQKYYTLHVRLVSRRVRSVPWRTCVARRDPAHMPAHPRGCGTRAVCLTPGYQARQTYGLPPTIPPPEAAEPPRLTNAPLRNCHYVSESPFPIFGTVVVLYLLSSWIKMIRDARNKLK